MQAVAILRDEATRIACSYGCRPSTISMQPALNAYRYQYFMERFNELHANSLGQRRCSRLPHSLVHFAVLARGSRP
jgi:hypothetical protein